MELKLRKAQEKDLDGLDQVMLVISDAAGERETVKRLLKKIDADPQKYLLVAEDVETGTICGSLFGVVFEDIYLGCVGAKAAGMKCIGITEESPDSIQKLKTVCDLAVKNYSELKIYLQ